MTYYDFLDEVEELKSKNSENLKYYFITGINELKQLVEEDEIFNKINPAALPAVVCYFPKFGIIKIIPPDGISFEVDVLKKKLPLKPQGESEEVKELLQAVYSILLEQKKSFNKELYIIQKKIDSLR